MPHFSIFSNLICRFGTKIADLGIFHKMQRRTGDKNREQIPFFYTDEMLPENHLSRIIDKAINWSFIYVLVEDKYFSDTGQPSIDPVTLIKIPFIQYLYEIKSIHQICKKNQNG